MSLPDRKNLLVGSSISSWEGMPAIHGDHLDERQASGFWIGSTSRQLLRSHCSSMTHVRRKNACRDLGTGPAASPQRPQLKLNSLGGQNLVGSREIRTTFQRDNLQRRF
jgi:hypothetical protein